MRNYEIIELRPYKDHSSSEFPGYKLSHGHIPSNTIKLTDAIDQSIPDSSQYSLLHAKLYGLHNHLTGYEDEGGTSVYFIDSAGVVQRFEDNELKGAFKLPGYRKRQPGDYNPSLKILPEFIIAADGLDRIYIRERVSLAYVFEGQINCPGEKFVILDAVLDEPHLHLHLLLLSIWHNPENEKFSSSLTWIALEKNLSWEQSARRTLSVPGFVQYAKLEKSCDAIYVISDSGCKAPGQETRSQVKYIWSQNRDYYNVKIMIEEPLRKDEIVVNTEADSISLLFGGQLKCEGKLSGSIDPDSTTWSFENNCFQMVLKKRTSGAMSPELLSDDTNGEYVQDADVVTDVADRLGQFTSETEEYPAGGATFNSQPIEECDFTIDKISIFERVARDSLQVTHRANLGSQNVLFTLNSDHFGLRHDVDACIWQPELGNNAFTLAHRGTLLALGYIQASKQQMKYFVCSPDMKYSAICEPNRHIFIYYQQKPLTSAELRHRATGKTFDSLSQQCIYRLPTNANLVGVYASNTELYLLCESFITVLKM